MDVGIVEKSGSWYSYGGERIGQGRDKARIFLKENPDMIQRLTEEVYLAKGLKLAVPAAGLGNDDAGASGPAAEGEEEADLD